ncbi:hypothetical protein NS274_13335 [Pseudomonas oryzihabitans]|uniref:YfdX family protein n=1 Tax=Pseudomonas rhizoryzae TaxID=2571129 RepID=UPI0007363BA3|nr:YfdX family protein [Pseudomonas rhizoryzae]APQ14052.1 hypothetical protein BJP27_22065 [Pseudomonas psychrotolerans]KTS77006.1 hypothetical protein NS274_13335 [Pseudomonas psychrotolerans]KTT11660.1 hypothetical protein NS2R_13170 [Pseudomonas psychrotolerans]KTT30680.1 hypothetical protein SB9_19800 [Pseudomonas psychrotolerans]KTT34299.1 hypothetical protein NS201_03030 [Pseudomonas psychrotolerans]
MNVKNKLAKSILVAAIVAACSSVAYAATEAPSPSALSSFQALSTQGQRAFVDISSARIELFQGQPKKALEQVKEAQHALKLAEKDNTAFTKAASDLQVKDSQGKADTDTTAKAWLPIWGDTVIQDNYLASPQKVKAVADANAKLKHGDAKGAAEVLRLAGVNVDTSIALAPLKQTVADVDQAAKLLAGDKYYEANLALKKVQDEVRFASTDVNFAANAHGLQPVGSFTETVTPSK